MKRTYRLDLMYDGTAYSGWQIQPHSDSIQQIVQEAVRTLVREEVHVIGSGRTDAGVHALRQVAHFRCSKEMDLQSTLKSLNGILPQDIRVTSVLEMPNSFHAQRSAIGKEYHYFICLAPIVSPFERLYRYHFHHPVDLDLLRQASLLFIGTHDFTSFANAAHTGAAKKNAVRTLMRLDVVTLPDGVLLQFEGNGFLYKMVRNIVGMLLDVSTGKRGVADIPKIFAAKDRRLAARAVPPQGLFLINVFYDQNDS